MKNLSDFTGLYQVHKTIRVEAQPIGETAENIKKSGILEKDAKRAEDYMKVKDIIDDYHKAFIDRALNKPILLFKSQGKNDSLEEFSDYYHIQTKDGSQKKTFEKIQSNLRKQIADAFSSDPMFKRINKKELIKEDLQNFVKTLAESNLIEEFKDFTTYFTGFNKNRMNMYVADAKSSAIGFRVIHQNLPRFIDNIGIFSKVINSPIKEGLKDLNESMKQDLKGAFITDLFSLDYYPKVLTQSQIDVYNAVIGGKVTENEDKIQGINELINLYNQKEGDKSKRLPKLKPLYKQILSDRNAVSFLPENFISDNETLESIEKCYQEFKRAVLDCSETSGHSLKTILQNIDEYDLHKIYLRNDLSLKSISQELFGSWSVIDKAIGLDFCNHYPRRTKESQEKYEERKAKYCKSFESISIGYINDCIAHTDISKGKKVEDYFKCLGAKSSEDEQINDYFTKIESSYSNVCDLLNVPYPEEKDLAQDKSNVSKIKSFLDSIKDLQHFVKPLMGNGNEPNKDEKFYGEFLVIWDELEKITPLYNKVRNRMTRKPYSQEKIKLNFDNSTLLNGWDVNKESDNTCVLLMKDGNYFLGIINKKYNKIFKSDDIPSDGACYQKMEYKLLPSAYMSLPKAFFSESRKKDFNPSKSILDNYNNGAYKKGDNFNINDCHALIDFYKSSIEKHEDWKNFGFKFKDTTAYNEINDFYEDVRQQGYKISFRNISVEYVDDLVKEGKLYLFKLNTKDFSPYSKGTPNMHTLYLKMLFNPDNLKDVVYQLNGKAEIFYRKSSIRQESRIIHPANNSISNKNPLNLNKLSRFGYDLIKDKRYTLDKYEFHIPITMNFKASDTVNINMLVNKYLKSNTDIHIIGIDRGERNLLYLSVIDLCGNIIEQYSLNKIVNEHNGIEYKTDYHSLLGTRGDNRTKEKQDWQTIESIKELKEGYLSQVIHKITQLMIKYNAIVVLEDLKPGFMRVRQKVDNQVYQKFETMLINKLNYLVDKKASPTSDGGVLKAYQLTNKFVSPEKMEKQNGFLFYIPAWNTSKMDPTTGFVNLFDTTYENVLKAKAFFGKFNSISYNAKDNLFEFSFDYKNFTSKADGTRTNWTICTHGTRIESFRNPANNSNWDDIEIDLTETYKKLFDENRIPLNGNIKDAIVAQSEKQFFENLMHLFRLTVQMRNSKVNTEIDYLISPVINSNGTFYDSRTCGNNLPKNADANGAYNIARKGLWVINQIKKSDDISHIKIALTNKEWLEFAQENPCK